MDPATVAVSIVGSLLGSGAIATVIAKSFDARAARDADARADAAADAALERERRRAQEATVDAMLGHGANLVGSAARHAPLTNTGLRSVLEGPGISAVELGRLMDTEQGTDLVVAYNKCKEVYRAQRTQSGFWTFNVDGVGVAVGKLTEAARWRATARTGVGE
jgi:hypothetical protein